MDLAPLQDEEDEEVRGSSFQAIEQRKRRRAE
jgi:hypothetical protein